MGKKTTAPRRRRAAPPSGGRVRLREEFRNYARAMILQAGEEVLASHGLHAARMEEVAHKARVAVGTIYNLIGDRDALVVEILRVRHEQLVALLTRTLNEVEPCGFREQAQACVLALFGFFSEHRRFFRLVHESENGPACPHKRLSLETLAQIREVFRELVARGIRQRVLRPDGRQLFPALLMGMMREVIMNELERDPAGSPAERAAQVLSVFIDGARTS